MTEPFVARGLRSGVRIDDEGIAARSWFVTRRWSWGEIAAVGWDDAPDGLVVLDMFVTASSINVRKKCLHIAIAGDEFVKEIPCVTYEPSSASDPIEADRLRLRKAIGDWVDRCKVIAPSDEPFQNWWLKQLNEDAEPLESDEDRIARIRNELGGLAD